MADVTDSKGRTSVPVKVKKKQRRGGVQPKPPQGTMEKTGLCLLNVAASDEFVELAKKEGLERFEFVAGFRVDLTIGAVGVYPAPPDTPDTVGVRFVGKKDRQISIHLGDALDENEQLRPETKSVCKCFVEMDATINKKCLWIRTWGALAHQKQTRTTKKTQS
jgi:hypothetical protein